VTAIKLALILPIACVLTSRLLYSLLYTHHADPAISTWYQIPDPAHQQPCPALWIIDHPALLILLGKMTSQLLSIASWHNSRQLTEGFVSVARNKGPISD
jgi:hypothetical protein